MIASAGALTSAKLAGNVNYNTVFAYGLFGGLISGPVSKIVPSHFNFLYLSSKIIAAGSLFLLVSGENRAGDERKKACGVFAGKIAIRSATMCSVLVLLDPV